MAPSSTPTLDQLRRAVQIHEQIERLQTELASILGGTRRGPGRPAKAVTGAAKKGRKGTRVMSPEAREKIAAAQRRRWAKQKKATKE